MNTEEIARVAHEINRAYCTALGDNSQPSWKDAPEWQRSSAINGVSFHLNNPNAGPDHSHNEWLKEKRETGWKFGPVKDPEKKEHPCFVPYDELPVEQKAKDYLFRAVVHALSSAS
ncbi:MAG TPA: RyR domain-containing protein [Rhizomicrobium sp.]|nr:RyR domain-containing protein [Rhizomicrobium sp.]